MQSFEPKQCLKKFFSGNTTADLDKEGTLLGGNFKEILVRLSMLIILRRNFCQFRSKDLLF